LQEGRLWRWVTAVYLQPGVAEAIAALAPLIAIPSARWIEGYRPPARYAIGVVIACWGWPGWRCP